MGHLGSSREPPTTVGAAATCGCRALVRFDPTVVRTIALFSRWFFHTLNISPVSLEHLRTLPVVSTISVACHADPKGPAAPEPG
jgi:hypothetical protein